MFRCFYQWLIWRTDALKLTLWESTEWLSTPVAQTDDDWLLLRQTNRLDKRPNKVWRRGLRWIIDGTSVGICAPYFISHVICLILCILRLLSLLLEETEIDWITINYKKEIDFKNGRGLNTMPVIVMYCLFMYAAFNYLPRIILVQTQIWIFFWGESVLP